MSIDTPRTDAFRKSRKCGFEADWGDEDHYEFARILERELEKARKILSGYQALPASSWPTFSSERSAIDKEARDFLQSSR
jgi:hypothetical protein